jgi:hypothetical protein
MVSHAVTNGNAPKPVAIQVDQHSIPSTLRDVPHWVVWRYVHKPGKKKPWDKPPFNAMTGGLGSSTDPTTWCSFEMAWDAYRQGNLDGVGFVLSKEAEHADPFVGVDLDNCRAPEDGAIQAWALEIVQALDSYTEISPSGTGIRIFLIGKLRPGRRKQGDFEIYETGRYVTVTGSRLVGSPDRIAERQEQIDRVCANVFDKAQKKPKARRPSGGTPLFDNQALLSKAMASANGEKFRRLWEGDASDYDNDHSRADLALCCHLAFWLGGDALRIDGLFRQSGLFRPKWDERHCGDGRTYGQMTIDRALEGCTEFYNPKPNGTHEWQDTNHHHAQAGITTSDGQNAEPGNRAHDGPWEVPIPLGDVGDVMPFPLEVLPKTLRALVEEIGWAVNCPPDAAAIPLLALAGGSLANSRHLAITTSHHQAPCLFAAYVGRPGTGKSAPLKMMRRPIDLFQKRCISKKWRANMSKWKKKAEKARGPRPILRRCITSDATAESLSIILSETPRGVVAVIPELSGLVKGMNQYKGGKGRDRQFYLSLWDGDTLLVDRKSDREREGEPQYVLDPFAAFVGTLQPSVLHDLRGDVGWGNQAANDGWLDRFLFSYPLELPAIGEQWREVSRKATNAWDRVVNRLLALSMAGQEGREHPITVQLTQCGREVWKSFTDAHAAEINAVDFPDHLFGPWSKLKGYLGRLALILHFLRRATNGVRSDDVDGESMTRAWKLIDYFKSHARKVYAALDADPRVAPARKVVSWIGREQKARFSRRDVHQGLKGTFKKVEEVDAILALLQKHGLIRAAAAGSRSGPGRSPSPLFESHSSLLRNGSQNSQNSQNSPLAPNSEDSEDCENRVREREPGEEG